MQFGLDIAQQRMPWSEVASRARFAEELGFDGVWGFDHFQPMYGEGPGECFEGNTTLAALTGLTERVRMGLLIAGMTYRHPSVYAAEAITIDHASGGRLELAYGAAWFDKEHTELGIPFPPLKQRVDAFEEAVQIVRGLLTTDAFTFDGAHYQVKDATLLPRPVQQPHPPIWIGGSGPKRTLRITAQYADVWNAAGGSPEDVAASSAILDQHCADVARDPGQIRRSVQVGVGDEDLSKTRDTIEAYVRVGVTDFLLLTRGDDPQAIGEELAAQLPQLRELEVG
jgi:F420-dependent oxidoreductase-like protein